ncbi:transcription factor kayak-like [Rhipicephalus sanguineus]|uniref:transcription factor kayak-like n=1 Tax=Rhipicephalus sanguineus TaxID=34632 RepID=UPI001893E132|nr:transcription factor kayak-like [Rhipicephalus sanguineus]
MSYPAAPGYEAYAAAVGQSYPFGNQGYQTSGMQQQMPSAAYAAVQNALQAAALEAQQQQQQRYAMANQSYYENAMAAAHQAAAVLQQQQQEQQQKLIQQQLQQQQLQQQQLQQQQLQQVQQQLQQQQLQQQYARQARMYQYPTQAYAMPRTNQAAYQQPGYPSSRSYGAAQTGASGYLPNGATGYSAGWPSAGATADMQSKSPWAAYQPATGSWVSRCVPPQSANAGRQNYYYSSRYPHGNYHSGYGVSNVPTPAGYRTQNYGQGYPQPGVYQVQSRYPQGR